MNETHAADLYEAEGHWNRARMGALIQGVVCNLKKCSTQLIPFEEVKNRLHLSQKVYRGIREIELDRIRGSVGRFNDFTSAFLPRRADLRKRWERVSAMVTKQGMAPIEVYQVGDAYFVLDGNHRVSVAREEGWKTIEAHVYEFDTPVRLSAEANLDEVLIAAEYAEFLRKTRLDELRPQQSVRFTTPGRYRELDCQVSMFREELEKARGGKVSSEEALLHWYDEVYQPCVREITKSGILARFPGRTAADLFIWMWRHEGRLMEKYSPTTR